MEIAKGTLFWGVMILISWLFLQGIISIGRAIVQP